MPLSPPTAAPRSVAAAAAPIRLMLVDDSAVVRRLLAQVFRAEDGVEVVGTAADGRQALERIDELSPHVVILDVEMPVLDGLGTLKELRARWPKLPVIMFSTLTERGAKATLDALSYGANDYVAKPSNTGALANSLESVRNGLVPLVREWGSIGRRRAAASGGLSGAPGHGAAPGAVEPPLSSTAVALRPEHGRSQHVEAVVIGSSTGGPNALADLVPQMPADIGVPLLLVQHMPETFTRLLAHRLDDTSAITVVEAEPGLAVERGVLYIARGGVHRVVERKAGGVVIAFDDGPAENSCRPAVDVLFRSAARVWGPAVLGVVLTGMGQDGLDGSRHIDAAGGRIITQDEASSVVWGMPGAVAGAGLSSENIPLSGVAQAICRRVAPLTKVVTG